MVDKVAENRVRRAAERQGLRLRRSPRRDPAAIDFERYMIEDAHGAIVMGDVPRPFSATLDDVRRYLSGDRNPASAAQPSTSPHLMDLATQWFSEDPARIERCGLPSTITDPAGAARELFAGSIPDARVVTVAGNVLDLLQEVEAGRPSLMGDAMREILRPVAGRG